MSRIQNILMFVKGRSLRKSFCYCCVGNISSMRQCHISYDWRTHHLLPHLSCSHRNHHFYVCLYSVQRSIAHRNFYNTICYHSKIVFDYIWYAVTSKAHAINAIPRVTSVRYPNIFSSYFFLLYTRDRVMLRSGSSYLVSVRLLALFLLQC